MHYRDVIMTVGKDERLQFLSLLLMKLHEQFSMLECGLAFPGWTDAPPNRLDTVDPFIRHADIGAVVRLIGASAAKLETLEQVLGLDAAARIGKVVVMPLKPCPQGTAGVAFCRDRGADDLGRRVRRAGSPEGKERLKTAFRKRAHTLAYVNMASSDGVSWRRMYLSRVTASAASEDLTTNSFGFTTTDSKCFLPDF